MSLIYVTVRDERYQQMACSLLSTLRTAGQFDGEIWIYCPRPSGALQRACQSARAHLIIRTFPKGIQFDRIQAAQWIAETPEATKHDAVMNLDADIICYRPVQPVLHVRDEPSGVIWFDEPWQRVRDCPTDMIYTRFMSHDERIQQYAACHMINVGQWAIDSRLLRAFTAAWWGVIGNCTEHGSDQAAFNYLIRSGRYPGHPFRAGEVANALRTPERDWSAYAIVHYAGWDDHRRDITRVTLMQRQAKRAIESAMAVGIGTSTQGGRGR